MKNNNIFTDFKNVQIRNRLSHIKNCSCAGCDHTDGSSAWNWLLWEVLHPSGGGDGPGGLGQLHRQLPPLQPHVEAVQDHLPQDVPLARGEERVGRLPGEGQEGKSQPATSQGWILYGEFQNCSDISFWIMVMVILEVCLFWEVCKFGYLSIVRWTVK